MGLVSRPCLTLFCMGLSCPPDSLAQGDLSQETQLKGHMSESFLTVSTSVPGINPSLCPTLLNSLTEALNLGCISFFFLNLFFFCPYAGHPQYMEVPRLGVELELYPLAYTIATATLDVNPLSEARDQTRVLTDNSWVCYCLLSHNGNSLKPSD